jgi:fatty-acyl-CoA synthase
VPWSWDDWHGRAREIAADLRARGIGPQDRVACLLLNSPDTCAAVLAVWLAGGVVVSLPLPARGMDGDAYAEQIRRIVAVAGPATLLCDGAVADSIESMLPGMSVLAVQRLGADASFEPALPAADEPAFVQFSSGSTTEPKGCVLTPAAIAAQLEMISVALGIDPERDVGVVWLPLSHDMGLFGCLLLTYWTGHHVVLGTPQRFLARPAAWLEDLAHFGGTVSAAPNFALGMLSRDLRGQPPPLALDKLVIGGERVDPAVLRRFTAVPKSALMPGYGLAEVVLAATLTPAGRGPRQIAVTPETLERCDPEEAGALQLCGAGPPIGDVRVGVDRGEIVVDSPSTAVGYLDDPEATAERFTPDGVRTGDLGLVVDGELYVAGRADDLIVVGGRNVFARDLEWAASRLDGVRTGNCAVVEVRDGSTQRIVALIEHSAGASDRRALARELGALTVRRAGVSLDACLFLAAGALPKTSSGKLQRYRCRELARTHELVDDVVALRT